MLRIALVLLALLLLPACATPPKTTSIAPPSGPLLYTDTPGPQGRTVRLYSNGDWDFFPNLNTPLIAYAEHPLTPIVLGMTEEEARAVLPADVMDSKSASGGTFSYWLEDEMYGRTASFGYTLPPDHFDMIDIAWRFTPEETEVMWLVFEALERDLTAHFGPPRRLDGWLMQDAREPEPWTKERFIEWITTLPGPVEKDLLNYTLHEGPLRVQIGRWTRGKSVDAGRTIQVSIYERLDDKLDEVAIGKQFVAELKVDGTWKRKYPALKEFYTEGGEFDPVKAEESGVWKRVPETGGVE